MENQKGNPQIKIILAFAAIYIVWGSTFFGVLIALKSFPPFLLSALRFLIAGIAVLMVCMVRKEPFPAFEDIKKNMLYGIVMFMGGVVAVVWAQQFISSSLASIIITTPFWFVILDKKQWHFYFSEKWILTGLVTGLVGVILLLGNKSGRVGVADEKVQLLSFLLIISGSFCWVASSLHLKYNPLKTSTYVNTSVQLLTASFVCFIISALRSEPQNLSIQAIRFDSVVAIFYLSIVSSLITFMAYMWLIKVKPPAIVSTYSYVNPLVAVLLGWAFAGESITPLAGFGIGYHFIRGFICQYSKIQNFINSIDPLSILHSKLLKY